MATFVFESGLVYYITVLAMLDAGVQGPLTMIIGALTLASYPLINRMARRRGKKPVMQIGFVLFALTFLAIAILGLWGINSYIILGLIVLLAPFSQANFGILPQVITADCAAYNRKKTGRDHAGMFVAANYFVAKIGYSVATILFTSLLLFGKDVGNDQGIRMAVLVAAGLTLGGLLAISRYDEKEILSYTREDTEREPA